MSSVLILHLPRYKCTDSVAFNDTANVVPSFLMQSASISNGILGVQSDVSISF